MKAKRGRRYVDVRGIHELENLYHNAYTSSVLLYRIDF